MASFNADGQEKTESPSQYRRDEFRRRGSVASSRDLNGIILLIGVAFAVFSTGTTWTEPFRKLCDTFFKFDRLPELTKTVLADQQVLILKTWLAMTLPIFASACAVAVLAAAGQVGFNWTWEPLSPNWSRINPAEGFKKLFSTQALFDTTKSVFKMILVAVALYFSLKSMPPRAALMFEKSTSEIASELGSSMLRVLFTLCGTLAVVAIADYVWARLRLENQMKMTKKEVKDEHKLREGDPMMKARIRNIQRRIVSKRMMAEVPKADVVITNPTHFAVALKYDADSMDAPRVVAKGVDHMALKIRELAKASNVPIVENKPLARALYAEVDVGRSISRELYKAVAQVLAYVYRLRQTAAGMVS